MNWTKIIFFIMMFAFAHFIFDGFYLTFSQQNKSEKATDGSPFIVKGIYWSHLAESYVPKGLSFTKCVKRTRHFQGQVAKLFTKSSKGVCGRPPNAVIKLEDGTVLCAKYRGNYRAYGEVLTFYLSRLLGMDNVPIVILVRTNKTSDFWKQVNISSLLWEENQLVTLIEWIDYSQHRTRVPPIIYNAFIKGETITSRIIYTSNLLDRTPAGIAEIVQWGTMILLDYLIAHLDRYVRFHIADENSKHSSISLNFTKNVIHSHDGKLWLIDNEMTLYLSYFGTAFTVDKSLTHGLEVFEDLLKTMCVFQKSVVSALIYHLRKGSIYKTLLSLSTSYQFLENNMDIDKHYSSIAETLDKRAATIVNWIHYCENKHTL